jgi:hypothetical protein
MLISVVYIGFGELVGKCGTSRIAEKHISLRMLVNLLDSAEVFLRIRDRIWWCDCVDDCRSYTMLQHRNGVVHPRRDAVRQYLVFNLVLHD